ncbi:MAG: hypothetical protein H7Y37_01765 [Anaerolineae bacterium]|nr:hypothetical protein [Gloeobacterales cyanobacterium ES-bin-313]
MHRSIGTFFASTLLTIGLLCSGSLATFAEETTALADSPATLTTLHIFQGFEGAYPLSSVIQGQDGNFYGTTQYGGTTFNPTATFQTGYGTVFKMTPTGTLTNLLLFNSSNGRSPAAPVIQGSDGLLYGTTFGGGPYPGFGTAFSLSLTGTLTNLHEFSNGRDGNAPNAPLVQGLDGNFYGTTIAGGKIVRDYYALRYGRGVVFKVSPSGQFTSLYTFNVIDGSQPAAGLVLGNDGNFYGTTRGGGASGAGTIFKIKTDGTLTTLYSFSGPDGDFVQSGLVQGNDGNFYGTTFYGGAENSGTVFKITPSGVLTTLHSFANNNMVEGCNPAASLIQGLDGNFYGTTRYCGANSGGTVFKITPSGVLSTLYSFTRGLDGCNPVASLIQASDGSFYGTTYACGTPNSGTNLGFGTVFKLTVP